MITKATEKIEKASIVLIEPCFLNPDRRCLSIGRGSLAFFSARARERERGATAFLVKERRFGPTATTCDDVAPNGQIEASRRT